MKPRRSTCNTMLSDARPRASRLFLLIAFALALSAAPFAEIDLARAAARRMIGETVPIGLTVTPQSNGSGGTNLAVTVQVNQTGDAIQVGTDHPSSVNSPTGSWPFAMAYPSGGSTSQSNTLTTSVNGSQSVTIYVCPSGVDSSNPSNWSKSQTVTIVGSPGLAAGRAR